MELEKKENRYSKIIAFLPVVVSPFVSLIICGNGGAIVDESPLAV
jgi:hypothetical protein